MLDWGADKIELLARYWGTEGLSMGEISKSLTKQFDADYTRSAVAGKVMRIGLQKGVAIRREAIKRIHALLTKKPNVRDAEIRTILEEFGQEPKKLKAVPQVVALPKRAERPPTEAEAQDNGKLSQAMGARSDDLLPTAKGPNPHIWEMSRSQCRFPVDREGGFHTFCGGVTKEGSPYCDEHHSRCNQKVRRRNADADKPRKYKSRYALMMH